MKIAITGSTGYLGSNLVREISNLKDFEVIGLSRKNNHIQPLNKHIFFDLKEEFRK